MKVVNKTGIANDTKIYDDDGREITTDLRAVEITIEAGDTNLVTIKCIASEIDVVGSKVST